ncbi:hypothetical protein [Sphingobacterium sp.]|uniref:hypothetical protein n=1 Tax=Sphingobacterium sp. TaxID=341027 RepID=UPI00289EA5DD|nr:hypothetical protein [Sphingobacterium sp.]
MERTLENVHVVIYSKKMLKEAIKRLNNNGQNIETDIMCDYEFHGNDLLIYHEGMFKVIQCLPTHPNHEITLNDLCEMIIDQESKPKELEIGKWYYVLSVNSLFFLETINNRNENKGYGIYYGNWNDNRQDSAYMGRSSEVSNFRELLPEEVEKYLIQEAINRGFKQGVSFISPNGKYKYTAESNEFKFVIDDPTYQRLMIGDHAIMVNGKWAELLDNPKVKMGDYVVTSLKNQPVPGFSVYQLSIQNSVDILNNPDTLYDFKVIDKDEFERLRKDALCGKQ